MLHSFHYYACYYTLLCLLQLHQQAASLTIIIDGATTNEWATRDEYQRLVDSSAGPSSASSSSSAAAAGLFGPQQQPHQASGRVVGRYPVNSNDGQLEEQQFEQEQLASGSGNEEALTAAAAEASPVAGAFESALDRLDLMEAAEQKRRRQLQRLRQLEQRQHHSHHHTMNNGNNININQQQQQQQQLQQQQRQQQPVLGARTLNDLVPVGDDDLDLIDPLARIKERGSAPRKFCGPDLVEVLDLVCQGRFYSYEEDAQTVYPTISKRFVDYDQHHQPPPQQQQQQQQHKPERRRKLRTLNDENGETRTAEAAALLLQQATEINGANKQSNQDNISHSQENNNSPQTLLNTKHQNTINDNYSTKTNLNNNNNINIRNKHSRMAHYRRIRGASAECCKQACHIEQLKTYCSSKKP